MLKLIPIIFLLSFAEISASISDTLSVNTVDNFLVDSILVIGNDITEEYIILREVNFSVGDRVNSDDLIFSKERIFSLNLFYSVELIPVIENKTNIIIIDVKESWYIYPLPFVKLQNNDLSKSSYGLFLVYKNFRGRNEDIRGFVTLGYNPSYGVSYYNPLIIKEEDISLSFSLTKQSIANLHLGAFETVDSDFDYNSFSIGTTIGKRFNLKNEAFFGFGFQYMEAPLEVSMLTGSNQRIDRIPFASLSYQFDSRDLKQFSKTGVLLNGTWQHKGFGVSGINYNIFTVDFREYRSLFWDLTARWRLYTRNLFGEKIPYYDYSYLGEQIYVRGHKNKHREAHNLALASFELNFAILEDMSLSYKIWFLPQKLTSANISVFVSLFAETGMVYNRDDKININKLDSGYGVGLTVLVLPFNAFRVEYSLNELGKTEFLFGTGFSF